MVSILNKATTEEKTPRAGLENFVLLSIMTEVAAAKNMNDLFLIINNSMKQLFSYDDGVISIINDDRQMSESKFAVEDGVCDEIVKAGEMIVFELEELAELPHIAVYVPFWTEQGMKQMIGVPMNTGIEIIGSFLFYTKERNSVPKEQFGSLYGICSLITIAVQNMLNKELNEKNELEKTFLLEIGDELALAKNKNDLARIVSNKLTGLIPFSNGNLGLIDPNENKLLNFQIPPAASGGEKNERAIRFREMPLDQEVMKSLYKYRCPAMLELKKSNDSDLITAFLNEIAYGMASRAAIVCLMDEVNPIGFLVLFSEKNFNRKVGHLKLLKGVANQVSSVASNFLTRESLEKKDREIAFLLSFSNYIAAVRDLNGLKFIVKEALKKLFPIGAYIITIKNKDNASYRHFLHDLPAIEPHDEGSKILTGTDISKKGTLKEVVLASEEPVIFSVNEIWKSKKYFFPAYSFWKAAGVEKFVAIRLKAAGEDIGIFWIESAQKNDRLLKGISAQIAIALANTLANASLDKQFDEVKRYKQRQEEENIYPDQETGTNYNHNEILGSGTEMQKVLHLLSQVAYTNTTVLLLGETGTGKELVAKAIHSASPRKDKPMIKVNCAALPASLIESELFGHEKGSFTGAFEQKIGKFELANNGTLFLDEIGEMPSDLQVKILRVLQEKEIERVGGGKTIKINVRIIAATNRDLVHEVAEGTFRSDLFYRLNVFPITLPPLRKRIEDIPLLVDHFISKLGQNTAKRVNGISQGALQQLMSYSWPGNIRELEHMIERSLLLSTDNLIKQVYLPLHNKKLKPVAADAEKFKTMDENERDHIIAILSKCSGKIYGQGGAAGILGVPPSTLNSRMKKLNIKKKYFLNNTNLTA
jgi:formate hydrogenlyase transcriptional activator